MPDVSPIDFLRRLAVPLLALLLSGCSTLDYYAHLGQGQWQLLHAREPVERLLADPRSERSDRRYARLKPEEVPLTECLKDTVARVMPFWNEALAPAIRSGKRVVVAAHGNSIRALVKYLDDVSEADIVNLNIPNGIPLAYELDADLRPIRHYYLGDAEAAARAAAAVAAQGKA